MASRRSITVCVVSAVAGLALIAVSEPSSQATAPPGTWSWKQGLPGEAAIPDGLTVRAAKLSGVSVLSLRSVVAAGSKGDRLTVYAGYDGAGRKCFGFTGSGVGRSFDCVDSRIAELAVLPYVSMGGSRLQSVDRASVMGIARSDVSRLEITLVDGSRRELPLNRWRAFAYLSGTAETLPKTLVAYAADGGILEEVNASVGPLCGGAAGPCANVR